MNDNVENIILEQLRELRRENAELRAEISDRFDALDLRVEGLTGILVGLGQYVHSLDNRVEHIEEKLGIEG